MINVIILFPLFFSMPASVFDTARVQVETQVKQNNAQKVGQATDKVEKSVREDEKGWTLKVRSRAVDYTANEWIKEKERVSCVMNIKDSQAEVEAVFKFAPRSRSVSPLSEKILPNLGDAAILLKYTTNSTVVVRKGNYLLTVTASSDVLAEKFARLYDAAIIVE